MPETSTSPPMQARRTFLLGLAILNLIVAAVLPLAAGLCSGLANLFVMDSCRSLDLHGVIDHEKLRTFQGGRLCGHRITPTWYPCVCNRTVDLSVLLMNGSYGKHLAISCDDYHDFARS